MPVLHQYQWKWSLQVAANSLARLPDANAVRKRVFKRRLVGDAFRETFQNFIYRPIRQFLSFRRIPEELSPCEKGKSIWEEIVIEGMF